MHRDVKLGLALGILVIGFAAAFCFPRQPATEIAVDPVMGLKLAAVDAEIRQERRRTFVGDELTPAAEPTLADAPPAFPELNPELPPLQTAAMRAREELLSAAPEPIPVHQPETAPARDSLAGVLSQPSMSPSATPSPADASLVAMEPEVPSVEEQFYTVQPGDTLSAISARTLGTVRRYEEIFEANRDVLSTPNSLQIGMQLRIPQDAAALARRTRPQPAPATGDLLTPVGRTPRFAGNPDAMPR